MKYIFTLMILAGIISCNSPSTPGNKTDQDSTQPELSINREHYDLKYPADWTIDTTDEDFDLDNFFSIDAPEDNGHISFFLFNTSTDEKQNVDLQVKEHLAKTLKNGTVATFETWGNYKGHGASIKGKVLGIFSGELRIFSHSNDSCSFLIVSLINDSERKSIEPGMNLIERSFKMK